MTFEKKISQQEFRELSSIDLLKDSVNKKMGSFVFKEQISQREKTKIIDNIIYSRKYENTPETRRQVTSIVDRTRNKISEVLSINKVGTKERLINLRESIAESMFNSYYHGDIQRQYEITERINFNNEKALNIISKIFNIDKSSAKYEKIETILSKANSKMSHANHQLISIIDNTANQIATILNLNPSAIKDLSNIRETIIKNMSNYNYTEDMSSRYRMLATLDFNDRDAIEKIMLFLGIKEKSPAHRNMKILLSNVTNAINNTTDINQLKNLGIKKNTKAISNLIRFNRGEKLKNNEIKEVLSISTSIMTHGGEVVQNIYKNSKSFNAETISRILVYTNLILMSRSAFYKLKDSISNKLIHPTLKQEDLTNFFDSESVEKLLNMSHKEADEILKNSKRIFITDAKNGLGLGSSKKYKTENILFVRERIENSKMAILKNPPDKISGDLVSFLKKINNGVKISVENFTYDEINAINLALNNRDNRKSEYNYKNINQELKKILTQKIHSNEKDKTIRKNEFIFHAAFIELALQAKESIDSSYTGGFDKFVENFEKNKNKKIQKDHAHNIKTPEENEYNHKNANRLLSKLTSFKGIAAYAGMYWGAFTAMVNIGIAIQQKTTKPLIYAAGGIGVASLSGAYVADKITFGKGHYAASKMIHREMIRHDGIYNGLFDDPRVGKKRFIEFIRNPQEQELIKSIDYKDSRTKEKFNNKLASQTRKITATRKKQDKGRSFEDVLLPKQYDGRFSNSGSERNKISIDDLGLGEKKGVGKFSFLTEKKEIMTDSLDRTIEGSFFRFKIMDTLFKNNVEKSNVVHFFDNFEKILHAKDVLNIYR